LIPALAGHHPEHDSCLQQLPRVSALLAHVMLETFSIMTSARDGYPMSPSAVSQALGAFDHPVLQLPPDEYLPLIRRSSEGGRTGGAIYDAQIAATAKHHGLMLLSRDRRAATTYDLVGVDYELI
jgi:predicted nucleic acid-binding protein